MAELEIDRWAYASQVIAEKRQRALFAKLSEVLGVPVDSDGNAVIDGENQCFSLEEAKMITKPHWKFEDCL